MRLYKESLTDKAARKSSGKVSKKNIGKWKEEYK
jgi:hypothetical protein